MVCSNSFESKAWLDNRYLKLEKSLQVKSHSLQGFRWVDDEKGSLQLALAICLEFYPLVVAKKVYSAFRQAFLTGIKEDGFDLQVNLEDFNEIVMMDWM